MEGEKQLDLATMVVHNTNTCDCSRARWNLILLDDVLVKANELLNLVSERSLHGWLFQNLHDMARTTIGPSRVYYAFINGAAGARGCSATNAGRSNQEKCRTKSRMIVSN